MVPVIDLAKLPAELEKLAAASTELGCFRITNHGMPASLLAETKKTARSLFEIPAETKLCNVIHNLDGAGYTPPNFIPNHPFYESFGIYDDASPTDVHSFCSVLDVSPHQRLQNVKHRVVYKKAMPRISIVLFLTAPKDGHIETQPAFIEADHPKLYQNFFYNEYRKQKNITGLKMGEILPVSNADHHAMGFKDINANLPCTTVETNI